MRGIYLSTSIGSARFSLDSIPKNLHVTAPKSIGKLLKTRVAEQSEEAPML